MVAYNPPVDLSNYRAAILATQETDAQVLYYDPNTDLYWEPTSNAFRTANEVMGVMKVHRSQKLVIRFDHQFPR